MKHRLSLVVALLALPALAAAQFSPEPLLAHGFISGKSGCVTRFEYMRSDFEVAFKAFIQKNNRFIDADIWHQLDTTSYPFAKELSEAECKAFLLELPSLDFDKIIDRIRKETECSNKVAAITERLGPKRPRVGIGFGSRSQTPTVRDVEPDSPAFQAGLRAGDVIRQIGNTNINSPCDAALAVAKLTPGEPIEVVVIRGDSPQKMKVTPASGSE